MCPLNSRPNHKPLKIVQFSDIHYDAFEDPPTLPKHLEKEMIEKVKLEQPDYVVITGDFVHGEVQVSAPKLSREVLKPISNILKEIHADSKMRMFGVLGNHDLHAGQRQLLISVLEREGGVRILDNDFYYNEKDQILLMGLPDYDKDYFNTVMVEHRMKNANIAQCATRIVLSHIPDSADCLLLNKDSKGRCRANLNVQIILSGHTHGGQFRIPGMREGIIAYMFRNLPDSLMNFLLAAIRMSNPVEHWEWSGGMFEKDANSNELHSLREPVLKLSENKTYVNVNRGVGSHFGFRLFCHPEMTVLELE
ncbi:hypothetical protein C9374_008160 [Naegleria lovaniensis]|uniref:Calcineurin-like phosphoesterase domain-containing protein n=1 Tax=Naegleria lovaniensis TaxID=51637 RepID=A0AA88KHT4_NAELO|nr:uncharacterized protein C9374_008160 [Naegleria lovaniensis]KAG2378521.1 hypothetical protein C9374_008160 [Naegleria lovaniensis]